MLVKGVPLAHDGTVMQTQSAPVWQNGPGSRRFFALGCLVEAGLGLLGLLGMASQPGPLTAALRLEPGLVWLALAATVPPLGLFLVLLRVRSGFCRPVRDFLEQTARPLFARWSVLHVAIISLLAGLGEELLFRGALQGWIRLLWHPAGACAIAAILFGLAHCVNAPYALLALLLGLYLGALWEITGSLAVPILVHALYDFLALAYLVRIHRTL